MAPKIHTPVPDFDGVVAGVPFHKGVGETDDPSAIAYFARHGYTVGSEDVAAFPDGSPSDAWKVDQLKAFADARGIDLGKAKSKAEILAVLTPCGEPPAGTPLTPEELEAAAAAAAKPETSSTPESDTV